MEWPRKACNFNRGYIEAEMKSISRRGPIEHKAPKVRMNLVCFRERKCSSSTQISGEAIDL